MSAIDAAQPRAWHQRMSNVGKPKSGGNSRLWVVPQRESAAEHTKQRAPSDITSAAVLVQ